jgi:predicted transcriptional regulator
VWRRPGCEVGYLAVTEQLCALPTVVQPGYTFGMKTAVSIPNELFDTAERLARRTRKSRSRLFSDALREYVARRSPDKITEAMDQVLTELDENGDNANRDPFVAAASRRRLEQSEW